MTRPGPAPGADRALDLAGLMRKLRSQTKAVVKENAIAKRTVRRLRRKVAKLRDRIDQLQALQLQSGAEALVCRNCDELVHPDSSCIYHPGAFLDIDGQRPLDSDSDAFGMWNCCDAEERQAIGCERGRHRFSTSS